MLMGECGQNSRETNEQAPLSSDHSTPRQQRRKRRSAAERRASHRRRTSAVNDPVQLAKLLNGLQNRRKSDSDEDEARDLFSPILDNSDAELVVEEPPEPSVPAPGEDDEVTDDQELSDEEMSRDIGLVQSTSKPYANSLDIPLGNPHRRSVSADHILYQFVLSEEENDQNSHWNKSHDESQCCEETSKEGPTNDETVRERTELKRIQHQTNLNHCGSLVIKRPISRKAPLLAHIHRQETNVSQAKSPSAQIKRSFDNQKQKQEMEGDIEGRANVEAESFSSPERCYPARNGEMVRSPEICHHQFRKKRTKNNDKRRDTSVSTLSAPCTHSAPTCSNMLTQLVDKFTSRRQYSDSNIALGETTRRSFKWKSLLGRNEVKRSKEGEDLIKNDHIAVDNEEVAHQKKRASILKKGSFSKQLGPLMEESIDEKRKTSSATDEKRQNSKNEEDILGKSEERSSSKALSNVRLRSNSSTEEEKDILAEEAKLKTIDHQKRPVSLIGLSELAKLKDDDDCDTRMERKEVLKMNYRIREEDSQRLDLFLKQMEAMKIGRNSDESDGEEEEDMRWKKLRLIRCSRQHPFSPSILLDSPIERNPSKPLHRVISTHVNNTTQTMPRKKSHCHNNNIPRKSANGISTHHQINTFKRKKGFGAANVAARRKSSHVTKAQVMLAVMAYNDNKTEEKASDEEKEGVEAGPKKVAEPKVADVVLLRERGGKFTAKKRGASISTSSLRQLLGGNERKGSRGKVAPKMNSTRSATSVGAERERLEEKEKKREPKTNSVILDTIWSIRPRRKKDNSRSLANLFNHQQQGLAEKDERTCTDDSFIRAVGSVASPQLESSPSSTILGSPISPTVFSRPQLTNPQWNDLELWTEEEPNWTAKYPVESSALDAAERKRQNIIYELVMTEKNHCQVLVLLRHVYQEGLLRTGMLDKDALKKLIPDVLDILLDFHITLFRRFRNRCAELSIVQDISDIICEEFDGGKFRSATIEAYTTFCMAREHSYITHAALMAHKAVIRKFFEFHEAEYKERSFKACMLLIAQRLTKYPILIEQILKYESVPTQRQNMQKAHFVVKSFALEINNGLLWHERKAQWEAVKKALDKGTVGKLIDPSAKQDFTYADLVEPVDDELISGSWGRKVHLVQRVFWRETMTSPAVELRLILCDDIIVFLRPKGTSSSTNGTMSGASGTAIEKRKESLQFFRHNSHSGVLPLYNTLVKGENLKRKSILLIVTDREQPDLIQLSFATNSEFEQCVHAIKHAKTNAPKFVRLSKGQIFELSQRSIGEGTSRAEKEFQQKMDKWQSELEGIFEGYKEDTLLIDYFDHRLSFFDTIRSHLHQCPLRNFSVGEEQQKRAAERERERLSLLLKAKFKELGEKKSSALAKLVDRAQRARDADLPSFFDDLYDLGLATESTPPQSSDEPAPLSGSSDSSETAVKLTESVKKKPRRVKTWNNGASAKQRNLSSSSSGTGGHPIRRHTTVPTGNHMGSSDEEDEADEETRKLPLAMNPISRRAATEIILDNIRLRSQNDQLKRESALKDLHLISLRARKGPSGETPERLETLKQKQDELQAQKRELRTECERREEEFRAKCEQKEQQLKRREEELRKQADQFKQIKEEWGKQTEEETTKKAESNEGQIERLSLQQTPTKPGTNNPLRIINTYCGAGPVPRPAIIDDHLTHSAHTSPHSTQLVERRAISQMELPRHLAVKTETKQADKVRKPKKI